MNDFSFSRRLPLGAAEALQVMNGWTTSGQATGRRSGGPTGVPRLWLRRGGDVSARDIVVLWQAEGLLWTAGVPVAVEVELARYDRDTTELTVRPRRLRWPVGSRWFTEAAWRTVTAMATGGLAQAHGRTATGPGSDASTLPVGGTHRWLVPSTTAHLE
jgi:hypothetical protein